MKLLGNLDCEARWSGVVLPQAVQQRISLYGALFAACADRPRNALEPLTGELCPEPTEPHDIWLPAAIDPARLIAHPGWTPPRPRTGEPVGLIDLAWADPAAKAANDRGRCLAIAEALGAALPGAQLIGSLDELDRHIDELAERVADAGRTADRPDAAQPAGSSAWVCKARWTAAGRDRARGSGRPEGELRTRLARLFDRFGPLVFEPWLDRVADYGICGEITAANKDACPPLANEAIGNNEGACPPLASAAVVTVGAPHQLITDARGGFVGVELGGVEPAIAERLQSIARAAAARLAVETGYRGPFAIDAFVYRDSGAHHLHPLCELNARYTFGWIARALARRLGIRRLGFAAPPPDATVLIAPGSDGVTAWCA